MLLTAQDTLSNKLQTTKLIPVQQIFDNACNNHINLILNYMSGKQDFLFKSYNEYIQDEKIPSLVRLAILHKDKMNFFPSIYDNGEVLSDIDIDINETQLQEGLELCGYTPNL